MKSLSPTKSIDSFGIFLLKAIEIFFTTKIKQKRVKAEANTHTRIAKAFCENARDTREKKNRPVQRNIEQRKR